MAVVNLVPAKKNEQKRPGCQTIASDMSALQQIMQIQLNRPFSTLLFLSLIFITACGTLEVGLDEDAAQIEAVATSTPEVISPSDSPASPTDNVAQPTTPTPGPSGMLELVTYIHPERGYRIDIPNAAMIEEEISGTFFIRQDNNGYLPLGVAVSVNTNWPEWGVTTPEEMLQYQTAGTAGPIFEVVVDNGNLVGAGTIVERDGRYGNAVCEKVVEQHMVFIVGELGYLLSIMADAPGRCDVTKMPETAQIINSFQFPSTTGNEASSAASTRTAAVSPTPFAADTLTPSSRVQLSNLRFASSGYGLPQSIFAPGTEEIFAIWEFANLSGEDVIRRVWNKNGFQWLVREDGWDVASYGSTGTIRDVSVFDFEGSGLEPGSYQLTLYLNEVAQAQAAFQILKERTLASSTETQVAWVQDGNILMLDAFDGSQRELARANEIVELLWLPDARHVLYVDRQARPDPNGPPWPQHTLWLVDTETGDQHQLSTFDENVHRIGLLPGARYIRALPGSDFADACLMDRRLVFVELDENYQRVALHDFQEFDSVLVEKPYQFFPEDEGKWISDHEYEVNVTAYCLTSEMGSSEEDLALPGRYRFNLETMTAVKVSD